MVINVDFIAEVNMGMMISGEERVILTNIIIIQMILILMTDSIIKECTMIW